MNFFKKLFTNHNERANEEKIEREYIFVGLELEQWCDPFYAKDSTPEAKLNLSDPEYTSLHRLFASGAAVVPHVALDTSIGIFIQSEVFNYDDIVRTGISGRHAYSSFDAIVMDAIIWKRDGTIETIPFKLNVDPEDEMSRLASALISVQKEIPFYFGRVEDDLFVIDKEILAHLSDEIHNDLQVMLVELYMDAFRKAGSIIETENISDLEMTTAGWVFHFDNEKLKSVEQDLSLMKINILRTLFNKIDQFSDTGYYTGWIAENVGDQYGTGVYGETTTIILTSSESLHMKEKMHQEIMKYLKTVKGYLREDGGYPLKYEGLPLLRRGANGFGLVSIDEAFLTRADELSNKVKKNPNNLYSKLLNIK